MADDRYDWLDGAAAEQLLRGEPVLPAGDAHGRAEAVRLAEALASLVPPARPGVELPGEAAAVAAFRAARAQDAAGSPAVRLVPAPVETAELAPLTGRPAGDRRPRTRSARRSLRFGLAAAVAGLTIGGVAAAATTGLLPDMPVIAGPAPSVSVSLEPSPEPTGPTADTIGGTGEPVTPRLLPDTPGADPSGTPSAGGATTGPGATAGTPSPQDPKAKDAGGTSAGSTQESTTRLRASCKDLQAGRLDRAGRLDLEKAARGTRLESYCAKLLGTGGTGDRDGEGDRERPGGETGGGTGETGGGSGGGTGETGGGKGGSTTLGFSTKLSRTTVREGAGAAGATAENTGQPTPEPSATASSAPAFASR
ncbi:hypothetical protein [Streptomyces sp. NPDC086023]|uniref:hypothetical protein n=1 Tax=Streptomyces sp. NPDC086023 TaxID=3365746 RepID=UPI0037CE2282